MSCNSRFSEVAADALAADADKRFALATCCSSLLTRSRASASLRQPPSAMSARKRTTSAASSDSEPSASSFAMALIFTSFALCANFKVDRVSSNCPAAGETHARSVHRARPPSASFNRYVSLLSLYGTCLSFPSATSTNALITLPRADSDLLIAEASFNRSPDESVLFWRSEPAKSTK